MIRHLTTLVLCGVLGSMVLVGNAEACHKTEMRAVPVVCVCACPEAGSLRHVRPACAPKVKHCGFKFKLPTFCHKKPVCTTTVAYCAPAPVSYTYAAPASYYPTPSPQASAQH